MLADPDLIIDIIDIGVGIAESDRDKIFNLFYTQPVGDCGSRGTGLGLAISRAMIEVHGGRIWAFAGPNGNGTCMRISCRWPQRTGGLMVAALSISKREAEWPHTGHRRRGGHPPFFADQPDRRRTSGERGGRRHRGMAQYRHPTPTW